MRQNYQRNRDHILLHTGRDCTRIERAWYSRGTYISCAHPGRRWSLVVALVKDGLSSCLCCCTHARDTQNRAAIRCHVQMNHVEIRNAIPLHVSRQSSPSEGVHASPSRLYRSHPRHSALLVHASPGRASWYTHLRRTARSTYARRNFSRFRDHVGVVVSASENDLPALLTVARLAGVNRSRDQFVTPAPKYSIASCGSRHGVSSLTHIRTHLRLTATAA
uniref:Uncharacterized protein n=1 Tax=Trichogramma kaykai TaxID=54128 RepID=A0ABD2WFD6_9HYME